MDNLWNLNGKGGMMIRLKMYGILCFTALMILLFSSCDSRDHLAAAENRIKALEEQQSLQQEHQASLEERLDRLERKIEELDGGIDPPQESAHYDVPPAEPQEGFDETSLAAGNFTDQQEGFDETGFAAGNFIDHPDQYWERETLYTSRIPGEKLYHVTAAHLDGIIYYAFMGIVVHDEYAEISFYVREENKEPYRIDSFTLTRIPALGEVNSYQDDTYGELARQFMENLQIKGDELFYYTLSDEDLYSRKYFKISLPDYTGEMTVADPSEGSFLPLRNVKEEYKEHGYHEDRVTEREDGIKAVGNTWDLDIFHEETHLFSIEDFMNRNVLIIGKIAWNGLSSIRGPVLFFDNSGVDYRCIWTIDPYKGEVTKIIPEHEAIHPFYFIDSMEIFGGEESLLYVEENSIKKAYPPEGWLLEHFAG